MQRIHLDPFRVFWCHNSCHHLPPGFSSIQRVLRCRCGRGWTGLLVLSATIDLSGDGTGCLDGALSVCLWSWNICESSSSEWVLDPVTVDVQWVGALKRKHLSLLSSTFNVHATLAFTHLPFAQYGFMMLHVGINRYLMASTAFRSQHACADLETHKSQKQWKNTFHVPLNEANWRLPSCWAYIHQASINGLNCTVLGQSWAQCKAAEPLRHFLAKPLNSNYNTI